MTDLRLSRLVRLPAATAVALLAAVSFAPAAAAHGGSDESGDHARMLSGAAEGPAAAAPPLTSDNVEWLTSLPGTAGISGCFAPSAPYFYTSGIESVTAYDVSDPRAPVLAGKLVNAVFENEAMNCGERRIGDQVRRFVLIGVDTVDASPDDLNYHLGGGQLVVVDVTDPSAPTIASRTDVSTSTHTVSCVQPTSCRYVYSAGTDGKVSIIDLRRLRAPKEIGTFNSPAIGWGGHNWDVDAAGYGLHTGADGAAVFDVTYPRHPRLVSRTPASAASEGPNDGFNDFILHNSWRPHAGRFTPGEAPSVANGNVLLVTEEDYEDPDCATAGSFQTWRVRGLDGPRSRVTPIDKVELADLGTFPVPAAAFCSAHWFDYHPAGFAAVGYYGGGLQVIDVRHARNLRSHGYALSGVSEVWDAYWVPRYRDGRPAAGTTNLVYTVDAVRGLDVYAVDLPGGPAATGSSERSASGAGEGPAPVAVAVALLALPFALVVRRRATVGRPVPAG